MEIRSLEIAEVKLIYPTIHHDGRGFFSETFHRSAMAAGGIGPDFVQDNHSLSADAGTVRGLHFQLPPHAQGKLLRVVRGRIFDVAVDIRAESPTFGQHVTAMLDPERCVQIWIPAGFAHGYCTLEPDTEVVYKVTDYYAPASDRGLRWDDRSLGIDWPVSRDDARLSAKDRMHPMLKDLEPAFAGSI